MSPQKSSDILHHFQKPIMSMLIKKSGMVLAILIISAALLSSIFRALTPWAKEYKGEVEHHLSKLLGQPVQIQTMETSWYWFVPVLKLQSVRLENKDTPPVKLDTIMLGLNIWRSIWDWQIQPGVLYIDKAHLVLRQNESGWHFEGLGQTHSTDTWSDEMGKQLLGVLLKQDKLVIKHVSLDMYSREGNVLPLRDFNVVLTRNGDHFKLRGKTKLGLPSASTFKLMADLKIDLNHLEKTAGELYVSAKNLQYAQWKSFFPDVTRYLQSLDGDIELWADIEKGEIASVQSTLSADQIIFKGQSMDYFKANMAFKPSVTGWTITADDMQLLTAGRVWPANKLLVEYDKTRQNWLVYLKNLEMEAISDIYPDWEKTLKAWEITGLHGLLSDVQIRVTDQKPVYFLARFDQTGWTNFKQLPVVDNIAGVVQYEPKNGRLELDSEQVHFQTKGFPKQFFSVVNGAVEWQQQESGLYDVALERLELSKSDLALSIKGNLTGVGPNESGYRDLLVDFSGREAQQWLPWIPTKGLRPEMRDWLKNDIKRIGLISGTMIIKGKASDFPFDNTPGEFTIKSNWSDTDLRIVSGFPFIQDVDIQLEINKRALKASLPNASMSGVPIQDLRVSIDDIGKDREVLIMDGKLSDDAEKIMTMMRTTSLGKDPAFNTFNIQGPLTLNLHFAIPLYPDKVGPLVQGEALFENNAVTLAQKNTVEDLALNHLQGKLQFSEKGFLPTTLQASFYGSPLSIQVKPLDKSAGTDLVFTGMLNMDTLKNHFNNPLIHHFNGDFAADLHVILDKSNKLDKLQLQSTLQGLSIELPKPFGKAANDNTPFTMEVFFKKTQLNVQAKLAQSLRTDLNFKPLKDSWQFDAGILRIGNTHAAGEKPSGLQVVGTIPIVDVEEWHQLLADLSRGKSTVDWTAIIGNINVRIKKLIWLKQTIEDLSLELSPVKPPQWSIVLTQKHIDAHLLWNPVTTSLSGYFTRLYLTPAKTAFMNSNNVAPADIPNLNLRVDNLRYGDLKLGNITFNTKKSKDGMNIGYCKMEGPGYVLQAEGQWQGKGNKQTSNLNMTLGFNKLSKTLENWNITPAVDASRGQAAIKMSWPAALYDFSWSKTDGQLNLVLKKGRITDLSKETEQKLGLGKLLSILSLQTIPRRLTLDFSDLAGKGYSFDIFKGNFQMKKGVLHTEDSFIDGPVAYASMKGNLDLVQRLYDVELKVSPHIIASLPVVATIAGGPIAGVATLVAGKIINDGMQQISGYTYRVTGPWSQPVVQQISIMKNKKQKVQVLPENQPAPEQE